MLSAEFEPGIPAVDRRLTYALYRTAKGIGFSSTWDAIRNVMNQARL